MKLEEYLPTAILRPFIKACRIIESQDEVVNRILPNTSIALAFRCKGQVSDISDNTSEPLPRTSISGLRKSVRRIHYADNSATLVVLFGEAGAGAFFRPGIFELFEQSVSLDQFVSKQ